MPWRKNSSKSYTFKESREKKSVHGLSSQKSPKLKAAKTARTGQNRSMEQSNRKLESFREFYKVCRPEEPPKTINVE